MHWGVIHAPFRFVFPQKLWSQLNEIITVGESKTIILFFSKMKVTTLVPRKLGILMKPRSLAMMNCTRVWSVRVIGI